MHQSTVHNIKQADKIQEKGTVASALWLANYY